VREYRTPGSVRGAPGNRCPYLDAPFRHCACNGTVSPIVKAGTTLVRRSLGEGGSTTSAVPNDRVAHGGPGGTGPYRAGLRWMESDQARCGRAGDLSVNGRGPTASFAPGLRRPAGGGLPTKDEPRSVAVGGCAVEDASPTFPVRPHLNWHPRLLSW